MATVALLQSVRKNGFHKMDAIILDHSNNGYEWLGINIIINDDEVRADWSMDLLNESEFPPLFSKQHVICDNKDITIIELFTDGEHTYSSKRGECSIWTP